jgi:hypothetical protein
MYPSWSRAQYSLWEGYSPGLCTFSMSSGYILVSWNAEEERKLTLCGNTTTCIQLVLKDRLGPGGERSLIDGSTSSSGIVGGYGRCACLGRPFGVVEFIRRMLRCLSRLADARVDDVDDGVEDVLQRMGVAMLDDVAVRYASAGDNIA